MCGDDCEHFRKSEMICDDHEAHMTRVLSFERRPWKDAFMKNWNAKDQCIVYNLRRKNIWMDVNMKEYVPLSSLS